MAQSDTHERVQQNENASLVHNRAKLVLEIEAFIECKPSGDTQSPWLAGSDGSTQQAHMRRRELQISRWAAYLGP